MRVLILSQYYAPEPVDKLADLARGLDERGHQVQVITGFPCYPYGRIYDGYRQSVYREEKTDAALLTRIPQLPDHSKSVIKRTLYYISFALSAATIGLMRARRADVLVVYQSALPIGLAGWVISRVRRIPLVLDVADLWPESVAASGMLKNKFLLACIRCVIKFVYHRADRINVITEGYRENLLAMGVPANKICLIHYWVPDGLFDPVEYDAELARAEGLHERFNVMYAGAMGPHQDLETVIDAALLLRDLPQVQFVLAGDGVEHANLMRLARSKGATNVRFLGRHRAEQMQKLYPMADALLAHLRPDPMSRVSIPSKTFAYMASGRPILMGVEGEASRVVEQHGCGIAVTPSDPLAMASAVRALYKMSAAQRQQLGNAANTAYRQNYCSTVQIEKFATMLQAVACGKQWPAIQDNVVRKAA